MTAMAFIIAIIASFYAGYKYERLLTLIKDLQVSLKKKVDAKKRSEEENKSIFLDPLDIVTQVRMEHEEQMRKLNPDD